MVVSDWRDGTDILIAHQPPIVSFLRKRNPILASLQLGGGQAAMACKKNILEKLAWPEEPLFFSLLLLPVAGLEHRSFIAGSHLGSQGDLMDRSHP